MTYKEIVYMVLDELKGLSDDFTYTEEHIIFLANKYRAFLLEKKYSDLRKRIPESNYQTICLDLEEVDAISGEPCEGPSMLRSKIKIPSLMPIGNPKVYPVNYYLGEITYISRERMRYTGFNKYLQNIIYCSLGPDNYLYFKSSNPQFLYLERVRFTGIFEDTEAAYELQCSENGITCDILDAEFSLESSLIPQAIELMVKELGGAIYKPEDNTNSASDDLANLAQFLRLNSKSALQKQIEN